MGPDLDMFRHTAIPGPPSGGFQQDSIDTTIIYQNLGHSCASAAAAMPVRTFNESHPTVTHQGVSSNLCKVGKTVGICRPILATTPSGPATGSWQAEQLAAGAKSSDRPVNRVGPLVVRLPPVQNPSLTMGMAPSTSVTYDTPRSQTTAAKPKHPRCQEVDTTVSQYSQAASRAPQLTAKEREILLKTTKQLQCCSFYFKDVSMAEAKKKLSSYQPGTFLLRRSSDPNFYFALSVKTRRGTTSIRIAFKNQMFSLDSDPTLEEELPCFTSIFELVDHYMKLDCSETKNNMVFLESNGRKDTPICLKSPCLREPSSLKHLSRLAINSAVPSHSKQLHGLPGVSTSIIDYLMDYPYPV